MNSFDVIVIGAGIQGAGIAQACAHNGWRVLVLERNSGPGLETSSASSKLIHGGLRYLETLQFHLVYECLRERKRLLKNAADITRLTPFYIPIYENSARGPGWVFLGLSLYAILGGLSQTNRFKCVAKSEWPSLGIEQQNLKAVFQYYDAQTDDRALTERVLASASSLGAEVRLNCSVSHIQKESTGFKVCTDAGEWHAPCVVNACGPWVNECLQQWPQAPKQELDWVQGVHLVLNRVPPIGCFYVESIEDGRPMFFLPWKNSTLVGTTERLLESPSAEASEDEIHYLLRNYKHYFAEQACTHEDITQIMAGIRVLPRSSARANARSRETLIAEWQAPAELYLGIYGGKLTSYRSVAERVGKKIAKVLKPKTGKYLSTRSLKI